MKRDRKILFLCKHNSPRSQMAEALLQASESDCPRIYPFANHSYQWRIPARNALAEDRGPEVEAFREVRDLIDRKDQRVGGRTGRRGGVIPARLRAEFLDDFHEHTDRNQRLR